jgi:uncharacterized membrane-anchored protein
VPDSTHARVRRARLPHEPARAWRRSGGVEPLAAKVPEIGLVFWVIKLVTTGIGEATSDFLGKTSIAMAGVVGVLGFAVAMRMQLRARAYRAPVYWFAVLMVAVFGTMAADGLRRGAGISYGVTAAVYAVAVAAVLVVWYRSEGTLSIHSITTRRRERFYWATVLATFALGTAAGDLTALSLSRRSPGGARGSTPWWPSGRPTSSPGRSARRLPTGSASRTRAPGSASATDA